ncbi:MAG: GlsB/YeaQ/YmgE family stress response membrane protein [Candidatus Dormibacteraeota bacterium]|nr:GlsB/YeaQ/YmgE family stress response membrane protein [Candidatus Dormibacteraeota bacterium]
MTSAVVAPAALVLAPPLGILGWVVIGLLAGAIAGRLVRGRGFGCLLDVIVGVIGAAIGGFLVNLFLPGDQTYGFVGSLVVALLGAVLLLTLLRLVFGRNSSRPD